LQKAKNHYRSLHPCRKRLGKGEGNMARVTVEDCVLVMPIRFDLIVTAAQRAKQIASGTPLSVDRDNDKDGNLDEENI